jgi:multidrug resistance protein
MEKDLETVEHPLSKLSSEDRCEPLQGTPRDGGPPQLIRTVSAAPYTIFNRHTRFFILVSVSISSLISPLGATTFYPALDVLAKDLHVTPTLINLSLTTYMVRCIIASTSRSLTPGPQIAQGIAPSIIAGMSDNSGRRLSFIMCFVIFAIANIGLALQTNYAALLVLRMVQAFGSSAAIALCTAVVADIATSADRGRYMGYATAGLLIGPAFGPTIGGVLDQYLGWRSTFWFLAIFSGVLFVIFTLFFPETCRNVVGNGSIPAKGISLSVLGYLQQRKHAKANLDQEDIETASVQLAAQRRKMKFPNPLQTLAILGEKESLIVLLYNGAFFTGMIGFATPSIPVLYADIYGLNSLDIGLCYITMGFGSLVSALTMGHVVDWNFRRHARKLGITITKGKQTDLNNFPIERVRLEVVVPGHIIGTLALIAFGWTLKFKTSLAGPEIALFFIGFGVSTAFNITNTLLIDLHRDKPATATAAVNFVRCLMSAGGAAIIVPMCHAMNPGWTFTFIALLYVVLILVVFLLIKKGQTWRMEANQRKEKARLGKEKSQVDIEEQVDPERSLEQEEIETEKDNKPH